MTQERPTGTVAFLFTDIQGSTRLVDALGTSAWLPVLARHRAIVREAIAAHRGTEIGTEGDSFFVVFPGPREALAAAVDAQRGLAGEGWPEGAEIRVRMGIHVGIGELDADGSYVGHDVHRAARVEAAAHGGQVLLSEAARDAVAGTLPAGVATRSLGPHRLKDLRPEQLTQLVIDWPARGLPADPVARRPAEQPADAAHGVHRPGARAGRGRGAAGRVAAGHAHGSGRDRQDATRAPGRGRRDGRVPGRDVVRAAGDDHGRRARAVRHRLGDRSRRAAWALVRSTSSSTSWTDKTVLLVLDNLEHVAGRGARRSASSSGARRSSGCSRRAGRRCASPASRSTPCPGLPTPVDLDRPQRPRAGAAARGAAAPRPRGDRRVRGGRPVRRPGAGRAARLRADGGHAPATSRRSSTTWAGCRWRSSWRPRGCGS